jgi:hypothetical protein
MAKTPFWCRSKNLRDVYLKALDAGVELSNAASRATWQNPKSEYRNPKQMRPNKTKWQKFKTRTRHPCFGF